MTADAARLIELLLRSVTDYNGAALDGKESPIDGILDAGTIRACAAALAERDADAERLNYLEREANADPILLHSLPVGSNMGPYRGLGLKNIGRTLRKAIDDMRAGIPIAARKEAK